MFTDRFQPRAGSLMTDPQDIRHLVAGFFEVPGAELKSDTGLREDLGADSLDMLALAITLEDCLSIDIPNRCIMELKTVGDVVRVVQALEV